MHLRGSLRCSDEIDYLAVPYAESVRRLLDGHFRQQHMVKLSGQHVGDTKSHLVSKSNLSPNRDRLPKNSSAVLQCSASC